MLPHQVFVDRSSLRITLLAAMALAFCVPARSQDVQTDAAKAAANSRTVRRISRRGKPSRSARNLSISSGTRLKCRARQGCQRWARACSLSM